MADNGPETLVFRVRTLEHRVEILEKIAADAVLHRERLLANIRQTVGVKRALYGLIFAVVLAAISNFFK